MKFTGNEDFWDYISGGIVILELVILIVILIKKM